MGSERKVEKAERRRNFGKLVICAFTVLFIIMLLFGKDALKFASSRRRVRRGQIIDSPCDNGGRWIEKLKTCSCTLGWIGNRCNVWHNHYCYFDNGLNYRGKLAITRTGAVCQPWTTDDNLRFSLGKDGIGVHNYCRNPDNDDDGLWCYVGGEEFISYCNATRCPDAVKEILSLNASEISTADDTSAAVQFLFGPLISGVCAGVVALLAFVAVAEYARRKRHFLRGKKQQENAQDKLEKGESGFDQNEKTSTEQQEGKKEKTEVRPLGGIITVDMDTGTEKLHTFSSKDINKIRELINTEGITNRAFTRDLYNGKEGKSSRNSGIGSVPPCQSPDANQNLSTDDSYIATPCESTRISSPRVESEVKITGHVKNGRHRRRRRQRRKRRHNPSLSYASEYCQRSSSTDVENSEKPSQQTLKPRSSEYNSSSDMVNTSVTHGKTPSQKRKRKQRETAKTHVGPRGSATGERTQCCVTVTTDISSALHSPRKAQKTRLGSERSDRSGHPTKKSSAEVISREKFTSKQENISTGGIVDASRDDSFKVYDKKAGCVIATGLNSCFEPTTFL